MSGTQLSYPDPPLNDGRVGMRPWEETDVECIRLAGTDPDIVRGTTVPAEFTPAAGLAFIDRQRTRVRNGEGVTQAVVDADTDVALGLMWVALRPQAHVAGLGYWVIPPARGHGVATAAVRLITPWAMAALRLNRLDAWVEPDNVASQHVLRSAGFELEGRLRNFLNTGGQVSDALVFSTIS